MKLLHTSDWHLGMSFAGTDITEDQLFFIEQICNIVSEKEIDVVLIAGDVFDKANASGSVIDIYDKAITRLCGELGVKAVIVAGNHDGPERLSQCSELLTKGGLFVSGSIKDRLRKLEFDDVDIYLIPWLDVARARFEFPEKAEDIKNVEDAYKVVCDSIREEMDTSKRNIAVSHSYIVNSETSVSDRSAVIGAATAISASVFDGFDYVALGHIHKPQDVSNTIRYSGTPMPYSFGAEESQEKSVTVIDTENMSREIVALNLLHKRNTLQGTFEELRKGDVPDDVKNGYVRVDVTDKFLGTEALLQLREIYPNILEGRGKAYEAENSSTSITIDELNNMESDPIKVFESFCRDIIGEEPDESKTEMFRSVMTDIEKEELQ